LLSIDVNLNLFIFQFIDQDMQTFDTSLVEDAGKQAAVTINFLVDLCASSTHRPLQPSKDQLAELG